MSDDQKLPLVERLRHQARYIRAQVSTVEQLFAVFSTLNDTRCIRIEVGRSGAAGAAEVMQRALLREVVSGIARLFDPAKRDRVTFHTALRDLKRPEIPVLLAERLALEQVLHGSLPVADIQRLAAQLGESLDRLMSDPRLEALREFRHQHLAHNLVLEPRAQLRFGYVQELLAESIRLAGIVGMAVHSAAHPEPAGRPRRSAMYLWKAVAQQGERDRRRSQRSWATSKPRPGRCQVTFRKGRLTK
ncbi:hypothetical protein SAMN02745194_03118 [Roseomonas rosea]|uniref:HEPN AbiU2-like domain-containing protein n=1 Tax=Muricoccus roseus TaxID=198092 RepID=A0A1M6LBW1_9PROT|nr:hypothetical protein [Roseomonas rosea]SHJ68649.1 hypothetical protein SAMN02745194_03118 [Roseomonas rosea]